jgi:lipopolysaccharide export system protein LptA
MKRVCVAAFAALALMPAPVGAARAQDFAAAFSGFNTDSDAPIQIEADQLEVRDEEKVAIYSGKVRVRQGETLLEAPALRVFYQGEATVAGVPGSQVSRIEAGPGVMVRSGDRTASGDSAVFDMASEIITMSGNVVLTEGENVVRGERLIVNLATNQGRIEGGRVQTLITPSAAGKPQ